MCEMRRRTNESERNKKEGKIEKECRRPKRKKTLANNDQRSKESDEGTTKCVREPRVGEGGFKCRSFSRLHKINISTPTHIPDSGLPNV